MTAPEPLSVSALELSRLAPYVPAIASACAGSPIDPFDVAGLVFRESACSFTLAPKGDPFGYGDKGHGFSIVQLDDRSNADLIAEILALAKRDREAALQRVFVECVDYLVESLDLFSNSRRAPLAGGMLRRAMLASYNADMRKVYRKAKRGLDPDLVTTGKDYGRWIEGKSLAIRKASPKLFEVPSLLKCH